MNLTSLQLLQQFYGEEKSAMDLDCEASDRRSEASHDTEAFHQEESCQQERDEDASSMSSVDYHYSEEDIDEYDDDDDDDDGDEREVGVPNPTPTEKKVEIVSTTGSKKYSLLELEVEEFDPPLQVWVDSWEAMKRFPIFLGYVNVYAYYNKDGKYGGYGVILRDFQAKPIDASAKFSADGKSFFTQVLMGVMAGFKLAEKHRCFRSLARVECNSIMVPVLFDQMSSCPDCRTRYSTLLCKWCLRYFTDKGWDISLVPLVQEIREWSPKKDLLLSPARGLNGAAHYLAKMGKKNRPEVDNKEERTSLGDDEEPTEIKPGDFPRKLKEILWKDAFGLVWNKYNVSGDY